MFSKCKANNVLPIILWNVILISLLFLVNNRGFGQYYKPPTFFSKLLQNWSVNANAGQTTFFGDVSLYDDEFTEKMSNEGSWAYGFIVSRQMTPVFGLSAQVLFGTLAGANSRSKFESKVFEYTGNLTINFVNLFMPDNDAKFFMYGKMGMGQFNFETNLVYNDPNEADKTNKSKSPEFLYLIGGGIYYTISNSFDINAEMTARLLNNDKIDGTTNKKDDDYYAYISLGVTYKINNVPRDTRYYKRLGMKSPLIRRN
jgi:hypothetical protein